MADQRASDADREQTVELLRHAGGDGRLTMDELDERLEQAHGARTRGTLDTLVADLADDQGGRASGAPGGGGLAVRPGPGGSRLIVSILGGATRTGRWRLAPRCTVLNVLGASDVDLTDAELAADVVQITVFTLLGGGDIRLPEGLRAEISDLAILGSNDVERDHPDAERSDGPLLRLRLISILGSTDVTRGRRRTREERRARRAGLPPPPPPR